MVTELISEDGPLLSQATGRALAGAFSAAVAAGDDPRALEGLGEALWWLNETRGLPRPDERGLPRFYRAAREPVAPARVAIFLARDYLDIYGNFSAYNGWLARTDTLLAEADACAEEGWLLARVRVPTADALVQNAKDARRIARVTGDTDLEIVALAYSGTGLIWLGRCKQGMTRLDEAMAAVTAGEVGSFFAIQEVYCKMLAACDAAADFKRARGMVSRSRRTEHASRHATAIRHVPGVLWWFPHRHR